MITEAKLAANRTNARLDEPAVLSEAKTEERSTQPTTPEGKARSSRNSFKHRLYSKQRLVGAEDSRTARVSKRDNRASRGTASHTPVPRKPGLSTRHSSSTTE
jgi:hypothetical protein